MPSLSSTTTTPENDTLSNSTIPPATTIVETSSTQANFSTSEKDSTVASTSSPETITQESNYTQNVTESFDTTSVQVDINITETESSVNMSDFTDGKYTIKGTFLVQFWSFYLTLMINTHLQKYITPLSQNYCCYNYN